MPNNTTQRPERKPFIPHHKYKLSAAQRTQAAFSQLSTVLKKEWSSIQALNLGVKSGTGVIDDVLITQLHHLASAVHMLAVTDADASRVLVSQCHNLSTQQFQNLQVMTSVTNSLGMLVRQAEASVSCVFSCGSIREEDALWSHCKVHAQHVHTSSNSSLWLIPHTQDMATCAAVHLYLPHAIAGTA
jgi:hypothetical protein